MSYVNVSEQNRFDGRKAFGLKPLRGVTEHFISLHNSIIEIVNQHQVLIQSTKVNIIKLFLITGHLGLFGNSLI